LPTEAQPQPGEFQSLDKNANALWQKSMEEVSVASRAPTILVWKTNETLDVVIKA